MTERRATHVPEFRRIVFRLVAAADCPFDPA
jgi:hypothetical protein